MTCGIRGAPARPRSPGQGQAYHQQQSTPALGWGDTERGCRRHSRICGRSGGEGGRLASRDRARLPGEGGFGDRRLQGQAASGTGGFGAPGASPQECSGFVAASLAPIRGQRAAWGPSPSGLRVLACPAEG